MTLNVRKTLFPASQLFSGQEQQLLKMYLPSRYSTLGLACHSSPFNYDDSTRSKSNFQNNGKDISCSRLPELPVKSHFKALGLYNFIRGTVLGGLLKGGGGGLYPTGNIRGIKKCSERKDKTYLRNE